LGQGLGLGSWAQAGDCFLRKWFWLFALLQEVFDWQLGIEV
jgi:hypothetical protein